MSHPLATRLTLLSYLHTIEPGEKVRFIYRLHLQSISSYSTTTAILTLQHDHSRTVPNTTKTKKALVNVSQLLGSLSATDTQIGEWVHVIGYINHASPSASDSVAAVDKFDSSRENTALGVGVQALVLWSAGGIKLDEYERVVDQRLNVG